MATSKLEQSLVDGIHKQLNDLQGQWKGTTKTWFDPSVLADESSAEGNIVPLFDGRFVLHEYRSSLQGQPFEGRMELGYHMKENKFQMSWMDTFHMGTGIMLCEGEASNGNFSVMGNYSTGGDDPQTWGWRTTIEKIDDNSITIRAYNITPEGEESLATETNYQRVKS